MGYSYGRSMNGRWILACDKCGAVGGVRKRKCRYTVTDERGMNPLPWCPAPALCGPCFKALGGTAGIHGDTCRDAAAHAQSEADAKRARLAAGDKAVNVAYGSWHQSVPDGMVLVGFKGLDGVQEHRLMATDVYRGGGYLSDYADSILADEFGLPVLV